MPLGALFRQVGAVARMVVQTAATSRHRVRWERSLPPVAVAPWNGNPVTIRFLVAAKHVVFAFDDFEGRPCVLKLAPARAATVAGIEASAYFANFVAAGGVPACRGLPDSVGTFAVPMYIPRFGEFIGSAWERAHGGTATEKEIQSWHPARIEQWGAMAGRLHRVARHYVPPAQYPLADVVSDRVIDIARVILPRGEQEMVDRVAIAVARIETLPRDPDWFGAIHGDLSPMNFFVEGETLRLFDYESSGRGWFAHDIASAFYTMMLFADRAFLGEFAFRFFCGYLLENAMPKASFECVPEFLCYQALLHYAACRSQRSFDRDTMRLIAAVAFDGKRAEIDYGAVYDRAFAEVMGRGARPR